MNKTILPKLLSFAAISASICISGFWLISMNEVQSSMSHSRAIASEKKLCAFEDASVELALQQLNRAPANDHFQTALSQAQNQLLRCKERLFNFSSTAPQKSSVATH